MRVHADSQSRIHCSHDRHPHDAARRMRIHVSPCYVKITTLHLQILVDNE